MKRTCDQTDEYVWAVAGAKIQGLRRERGITLKELSDYLKHKSITTLQRFENNEGRLKLYEIILLSGYFKIPIAEILPPIIEVENISGIKEETISKLFLSNPPNSNEDKVNELIEELVKRRREEKK